MRVVVTGASGFIGRHVVRALSGTSVDLLGLDKVAGPGIVECDVTSREQLQQAFVDFCPTHVLNLAGDTDLSIPALSGYAANINGTDNVASVCEATESVTRLVHVSTQHVCRTPEGPDSDFAFEPDTRYAMSKVISELLVRRLRTTEWVIARPTNIWGPGHPNLTDGFWQELARGRYVHPWPDDVIRGYGYVRNAADQLVALLSAPQACGRVVYVTDEPMRQLQWVDAFAVALTGRRARRVPRPVIATTAVAGEAVRRLGLKAPLYWSRYRSMTTTQRVPYETTVSILGSPRIGLEEGVEETVAWLRSLPDFRWRRTR